jgi:hypothetical protein
MMLYMDLHKRCVFTTGVAAACLLSSLSKTYKATALPPLRIPEAFATTLGRPWLVNLFDLPVWVRHAPPP